MNICIVATCDVSEGGACFWLLNEDDGYKETYEKAKEDCESFSTGRLATLTDATATSKVLEFVAKYSRYCLHFLKQNVVTK